MKNKIGMVGCFLGLLVLVGCGIDNPSGSSSHLRPAHRDRAGQGGKLYKGMGIFLPGQGEGVEQKGVVQTEQKIHYADLEDDDMQKYVGKDQPFNDKQYEPEDLVQLSSTQSLKIQGNRSLRQEASEQLVQLSEAFYQEFQKPIVVMSAYRSYSYQKNQISESCKQSGYCAREGESEHQLGLAVDVWEATNEEKFLAKYRSYYEWLGENAHLYGFHQSYQNGKKVDGYAIEPWHWRYVGVELATVLWEKGMSFSEFL